MDLICLKRVVKLTVTSSHPFLFPILDNNLYLCHVKTLGNLSFSDVFRGYRKRPVVWIGLKASVTIIATDFPS